MLEKNTASWKFGIFYQLADAADGFKIMRIIINTYNLMCNLE